MENSKPRHELRKCAVTALYQHFLLKKDIKKIIYELYGNEVDGFLYAITIGACEHEKTYVDLINKNLKSTWDFNRLGYVEQAILFMAVSELDMEHAPRGVIINEAVTLAKLYCDDSAYKLINGVLDKI